MSFWIKKYKIELERLPVAVITKSILVVFLCMAILSVILLLLPIQDTIKGDVVIYAKGQPLSLNAPSSGFLHLTKSEYELISKGDIIATIDVDITPVALKSLKRLIEDDFSNAEDLSARALLNKIDVLSKLDIRGIKPELLGLADRLRQLDILTTASDPKDLLQTLDRSINLKLRQVNSISALNASRNRMIDIIKGQIKDDSILYKIGGLSEREYIESKKAYLDQESILIENDIRKQVLTNEIIQDEKEKFVLMQEHRSKVEELKFSIIDQVGQVRKRYQEYLDQYVIISPTSGYASMPHDLVDQETIEEGSTIMYLSKSKKATKASSEMYVSDQNAGKIEEGMRIRIGLSEFDQKEYGIYYTTVKEVSEIPQNGQYKVLLECSLPLTTSYDISLPTRDTYNGRGEIMVGKINLFTKISREIQFNKAKYASL